MKLEWLGKYRDFIESLIRYTNSYGQVYTVRGFHKTSVPCTLAQIQVLEYILENEEKHQNMARVAARLGISPSCFSKNVKQMTGLGLLERYRTNQNQKEIIIKASPLGRQVYEEYHGKLFERRFRKTFELLDTIPEEHIRTFSDILLFNAKSIQEQLEEMKREKAENEAPVKLIKID